MGLTAYVVITKKGALMCRLARTKSLISLSKRSDSVIYCDPPYAPLSTTANFTSYAGNGFTLDDQAALADIAEKTAKERGISVLISNHDTTHTRRLYRGAQLNVVKANRTISRNGAGRNKVDELLALFTPHLSSQA
ncbi:DNA adenine methylase [Vibrio cholerae]|nr:DNA adenine methylase [Vibrio cholerae]